MRLSLLEVLRSPLSKQPFQIDVFEEGDLGEGERQIRSGRIFTPDGEEYPVIRGVPRMLTGSLLVQTMQRYPEFITSYGSRFTSLGSTEAADALKVDTMESFGVQWNLFPDMLEEWKQNFREYLAPMANPEDLHGKRVLDCGCGFGRHLYQAADFGARMVVGVDLSHAVDAAVINVSRFENAHVVQGDIYRLPVAAEFDFVYSLGVLQHLPDPHDGFVQIASRARPGGRALVWMYGRRPMGYHLVVDTLRRFTVGMKSRSLYRLSWALAALSFGVLALPRRSLEAVGLKSLGMRIPYSSYAKYPFQVSHADWYDRLAAPKTVYLLEEDAWDMLRRAGLLDPQVVAREEGGWKATGVRRDERLSD